MVTGHEGYHGMRGGYSGDNHMNDSCIVSKVVYKPP